MQIVSTMGSGSFGRNIELERLITELQYQVTEDVGAEFHNQSMVTFRLNLDGPAYTLYRTGSFQIRGPETEEKLLEAEKRLQEALDKLGFTIEEYEFTHVTSVFVHSLDTRLDLNLIAVTLGLEQTEYEPEQFPAVIYRPPSFAATLLIFATGKIFIGGTTDRQHARDAIDHLLTQIDQSV